jgi:hypothetical protein
VNIHLVPHPSRIENVVLFSANAHRLFVTRESSGSTSPVIPSFRGNLSGIVSIVDSSFLSIFGKSNPLSKIPCIVLSLFAQLAKLPDIDPQRMQRHRRASSASSTSSRSEHDLIRSRSSSRTSTKQGVAARLPNRMGREEHG